MSAGIDGPRALKVHPDVDIEAGIGYAQKVGALLDMQSTVLFHNEESGLL